MKIKPIYFGILLMVSSAACTAIGQAFWKLATDGLLSWELYVGFCCYGLGAILMIIAFKYGELSVLHPLLSLGYIFAMVIGVYLLDEVITFSKVLGNLLIIAGAVIIGISSRVE